MADDPFDAFTLAVAEHLSWLDETAAEMARRAQAIRIIGRGLPANHSHRFPELPDPDDVPEWLADLDFLTETYVLNGETALLSAVFAEDGNWGFPAATVDEGGLYGNPVLAGDLLSLALAGCAFVVDVTIESENGSVGIGHVDGTESWASFANMSLTGAAGSGSTMFDANSSHTATLETLAVGSHRFAYTNSPSLQSVSLDGAAATGFIPVAASPAFGVVAIGIGPDTRITRIRLCAPQPAGVLRSLSALS